MFVHSVLLLGLTIGTSPNLCAEAEVFAATPAMHLRPTYLPISRVIENMQAGLAERPGDRRLYMNIARAHSYAFQVADEGKPVNWRAVVRMTPKAYEDSGEGSRGHDAPKDEGDREVTYLTMSERLHHLSASIAAFNEAIEMDPFEPSAYLGIADLLASCNSEMADAAVLPYPAYRDWGESNTDLAWYLERFTSEDEKTYQDLIRWLLPRDDRPYSSPPQQCRPIAIDALLLAKEEATGERRVQLRQLILDYCKYQTAEYFFRAFDLAIGQDAYRDSQPGLSNYTRLVSGEAGIRYLEAIEEYGPRPFDQARIRIVEASLEAMKELPHREWVTPIVFSLNAPTPLETLLASETVVSFDLDGTGREQSWPWVSPETSILVWDPEETGEVTSGRQLFGSVTWWLFFDDGYRAMDALDDNRDGELSGDELAGLAVWTDANSNGVSDEGEVVPIGETGIEAIACVQTDTSMGMPANMSGLRMSDGRVLPTYDWVAKEVEAAGSTR